MKGATGGQCQTPARECRPRNIPTTREATTTKRIRNQDGRYTSHYRNGGRFNAAACKATSNEKKKTKHGTVALVPAQGGGKGGAHRDPTLSAAPGVPQSQRPVPPAKKAQVPGAVWFLNRFVLVFESSCFGF